MYRGEKQLDGHWYYFNQGNGRMVTGFTNLPDGRTVYYNEAGQIQNGDTKIGNDWYYFSKTNGEIVKDGLKYVDGTLKYFNKSGVRQSGLINIDGQNYIFSSFDGAIKFNGTGEQKVGNNTYVTGNNGKLLTGFQRLSDGRTVYLDPSTAMMVKGEYHIDGNWYYFGIENGTMVTGFQKLPDDRTVYYDSEGRLQNGEKRIGSNWYFFDLNDGHMTTGFKKLPDGRIVFYNGVGQIQNGERHIDGEWYYFDLSDGHMTTGFKKLPDGRTVYYNEQGRLQNGWRTINGNRYYFDTSNGNMARGKVFIDGQEYTFNDDGIFEDYWNWPFPQDGEGHFSGAQLFGVNPGGQFRQNGFHDGLDFGSIDHPGAEVHAIHGGIVKLVGYGAGLDWYAVVDTGEYLVVYQEAFASRSDIHVQEGQRINTGDVIGIRKTSHVHIGITRQHNFNVALASSFNNNGTWLNPLTIIKSGLR